MANKRFLGLGFTFAATDKGLEKKLQSVHSHLRGISDSLNNINKSGASGMSSIGKMAPGVKQSQFQSPAVQKQVSRKVGGMSVKASNESKIDEAKISTVFRRKDLNVASENFIKSIASVMKEYGLAESALKDFLNIKVKFNTKDKRITKESKDNILTQAATFIKASDTVTASISNFTSVFKGVGEYFTDVKNSFVDFLSAIGFDLRSMIPKELAAFGGLAKSIFKPLMDAPSALFGAAKKSIAEKLQADANARLAEIGRRQGISNDILQKLSSQIGGSGSGQENLFAMAEATAMNTKDDGKGNKGFFSKFLGMFSGIGKILSGLGMRLMAVPYLGKVLSGVASAASLLLAPFRFLGGFVGTVARLFGSMIGPLAAAAVRLTVWGTIIAVGVTAVSGFVSGLIKAKDGVMSFGSGISSFVGSIASYIGSLTRGIPALETMWDAFTSFASFLSKLPSLAYDLFTGGFSALFGASEKSGMFLGNMLGAVGNSLKAFAERIDATTAQNNFAPINTTQPVPLVRVTQQSDAYKSLAVSQADIRSAALLQRQLEVQEKTNEILSDLRDRDSDSSGKNINVNIQTNDRAFNAKMERTSAAQLGASGGL